MLKIFPFSAVIAMKVTSFIKDNCIMARMLEGLGAVSFIKSHDDIKISVSAP